MQWIGKTGHNVRWVCVKFGNIYKPAILTLFK